MRKLFLMVYNDKVGTREQVKDVVDKSPHVITWRYDIPHCFYLVSESTAKEICDSIRSTLPNGRLVVVEVGDDFWGWASKETWHLFRNKRLAPKAPS